MWGMVCKCPPVLQWVKHQAEILVYFSITWPSEDIKSLYYRRLGRILYYEGVETLLYFIVDCEMKCGHVKIKRSKRGGWFGDCGTLALAGLCTLPFLSCSLWRRHEGGLTLHLVIVPSCWDVSLYHGRFFKSALGHDRRESTSQSLAFWRV